MAEDHIKTAICNLSAVKNVSPINKRTMRLVFNEGSRIGIFLFINSDIINAHGIMAMFSKVAIEFRSPEYLFFLANTNDHVVSQLCSNFCIQLQ